MKTKGYFGRQLGGSDAEKWTHLAILSIKFHNPYIYMNINSEMAYIYSGISPELLLSIIRKNSYLSNRILFSHSRVWAFHFR